MLKDIIARDVNTVFLNMDEFAEHHSIDGVDVVAVVEGLTSEQHLEVAGRNMDGLLTAERVVVHVASVDLPARPMYGDTVELDNRHYIVENSSDDMGIITLTLVGNGYNGEFL